MFARFTLHTVDPDRMQSLIDHYEDDVATALSQEPGHRGMSVLVNDDSGLVLVQTYWATERTMRSNDSTFARPVHDAAFFGATVSIDHFEVARFAHAARARPGAAIALTHWNTDPAAADAASTAYGYPAVAPLAASDGFCTAVVLTSSGSGHAIVETTWRDRAALLDDRSLAAARRLQVAADGHSTVLAIEQYRLDFHSAEPK